MEEYVPRSTLYRWNKIAGLKKKNENAKNQIVNRRLYSLKFKET